MNDSFNIIHEKENEKFDLKVNYLKIFGEWCIPLSNYLKSNYQSNLMFYLHNLYSKFNLNIKLIEKKDIFKAYLKCKPSDVKVVILNFNPTFNKRSNGLAFGNKPSLIDDYDDKLINLFNVIEQIDYDNFKLNKDYTLESWAKQGVLLLNFPLINCTIMDGLKFYTLISETIQYLNSQSGIIFCFINNTENKFRAKICDKTNIILNSNTLDYKLLSSINHNLEKMNGRDHTIKW